MWFKLSEGGLIMPYTNPFREDRLRRMKELLDTIAKAKEMNIDKILGLFGYAWGSTEESIRKMLIQLEKAGYIEINNERHIVRYKLEEGEQK
jgi:sugar phosphate isomerase/epimerase